MGNLLSHKTAEQIAHGYNINGKTAIVTGGNRGIGLETVRVLCKIGCKVIMACRDVKAGQLAKRDLVTGLPKNSKIIVKKLDLASFKSIECFANEIINEEINLDFLILNAAIMGANKMYTREGFEMHFGVNYLGHFYLTKLLMPLIEKEINIHKRIIILTCGEALSENNQIKLKNLAHGTKKYDWNKTYKNSKICSWYFAQELGNKLRYNNVSVFAVDPGYTDTWIYSHLGAIVILMMSFSRLFMQSVEHGAATVIYACLKRKLNTKTALLLSRCNINKITGQNHMSIRIKKALWDMSEDLIESTVADCYCDLNKLRFGKIMWKAVFKTFKPYIKTITQFSEVANRMSSSRE